MNYPPLERIADELRALAKDLDRHAGHDRTRALNGTCRCIQCRARLLGSGHTGWPTATLGDGTGARTADPTSSTERAALDPDRYATIDQDLARTLRHIWHTSLVARTLMAEVDAHAPDDDPVPAGTSRPRRS